MAFKVQLWKPRNCLCHQEDELVRPSSLKYEFLEGDSVQWTAVFFEGKKNVRSISPLSLPHEGTVTREQRGHRLDWTPGETQLINSYLSGSTVQVVFWSVLASGGTVVEESAFVCVRNRKEGVCKVVRAELSPLTWSYLMLRLLQLRECSLWLLVYQQVFLSRTLQSKWHLPASDHKSNIMILGACFFPSQADRIL